MGWIFMSPVNEREERDQKEQRNWIMISGLLMYVILLLVVLANMYIF